MVKKKDKGVTKPRRGDRLVEKRSKLFQNPVRQR